MPKLFISYRRQDSGPIARRLAETLSRAYGKDSVFLDTDAIRISQRWPEEIESNLREASVLIVLIGQQWLHIHNEVGQRRIDLTEDWVATEIATTLRAGKNILPVLVGGAAHLNGAGLKEPLQELEKIQAYELKDEYWKRDIGPILDLLDSMGFTRQNDISDAVFPARLDQSKALTQQEIDSFLDGHPGWKQVTRPALERDGSDRVEFYKIFRFSSFEDAMHFMLTASRWISRTGHHPDWQNLWINIRVWLTTWDIGHKPTFKDIRLAEYLDKLYLDY